MNSFDVIHAFLIDLKHASPLEYLAVISGVVSVWLSKKESIWVYPTGLLNTSIYVYLSVCGSLFGEATVNLYYTIMSIYGWWLWNKKDLKQNAILKISYSSLAEKKMQLLFFATCYLIIFVALTFLKNNFAKDTIPFADAFASAAAFTAMYLMTKKKIENWQWWILTNIASIPLYYIKNYVLTSVYYFILLVIAIAGWAEWRKKII